MIALQNIRDMFILIYFCSCARGIFLECFITWHGWNCLIWVCVFFLVQAMLFVLNPDCVFPGRVRYAADGEMCRSIDHSVSLYLPYRDLSIDLSLLTGNTQFLSRKYFGYPAAGAVSYLIDLDLPARRKKLPQTGSLRYTHHPM